MGGASRDDGTQGLSSLAQRLPAALAGACDAFDDELACLARDGRLGAGFFVARRRLLAPLSDAAQHAARFGTPALSAAVRNGAAQVRAALRASLGSAPLRAAANDIRGPQSLATRRTLEDTGVFMSPQHQRRLGALDDALAERTDAFADHLAAGPGPARVRDALAHEDDAAAREALWSHLHHHAQSAAGLCLDILRLRRDRAQATGFESFGAWVDRDAALCAPRDAWLAQMAAAARSRAGERAAIAPWDRHRSSGSSHGDPLRAARDDVGRRLAEILKSLAPDAHVVLDLEPRAGKRAGSWTYRAQAAPRTVTICASLPPELGVDAVRCLLHETGHAAEALMAPADIFAPLDTIELASTGLEPFAWSLAALSELGIENVDAAALAASGLSRLGQPALHQVALAVADRALHTDFDPDSDGSPIPWARRVLASVEGVPRDPRDAALALHLHLFGRPHGYAARYAAYPLGDALALHLAHNAPTPGLADALTRRARHLWTEEGRRDPLGAILRLSGDVPGPAAFVRIARP